MPYIPMIERLELAPIVKEMDKHIPIEKPGRLSFLLTAWFRLKGVSWTNLCLFAGALLLTILEVYRRRGAEYEDKKKEENGDVC